MLKERWGEFSRINSLKLPHINIGSYCCPTFSSFLTKISNVVLFSKREDLISKGDAVMTCSSGLRDANEKGHLSLDKLVKRASKRNNFSCLHGNWSRYIF